MPRASAGAIAATHPYYGYGYGPGYSYGPTYYAPGPSYTPSATNTALDTPSYDVFGLYFTWAVHKDYEFRFGVDNLFNVDPAITGATSAIPGFTVASTGQGTTNEGFYDALGRRFYIGLHAKF